MFRCQCEYPALDMAVDRVAAESNFGIHLRQIGSGADLVIGPPGTVSQSTMFSG